MFSHKNIIIFIAGLVFNCQSFAYDDVQYFLQEKISAPHVRWDNIVGVQPFWLSAFRAKSGSFITMPKGEEIIIRLNRDSILRLHSENYDLHPEMFDVRISNGTGLYVSKNLLRSENCNDLLLVTENNAGVARITLKDHVKDPVKITFLTSRYEPIPQLAFYPNKHSLNSSQARLMEIGHFVPKKVSFDKYNYLKTGIPAELTITGPVRLEILSHYVYDVQDLGQILPYRIKINLDGKFFEEASFSAHPEYHYLYLNNQVLSKASTYYLEIPEDTHKATIIADGPVFVQFHSLENSGYLLARNSNPQANIAKKELLTAEGLHKLKPSIVTKNTLIAEENEWKAAGLRVANVADDLWRQRKDDLSFRNFRDDAFNTYTFFRDILPSNDDFSKKLSLDWVVNYHLADTNTEDRPYKFIDTQTSQLLKQLTQGHFIEVMPGTNFKYNYQLPKLSSDSELKIIVQQGGLNEPQEIFIQYDNKNLQRLVIYPQKDLPNSAFSLNTGLIGLSVLERNDGYKQPRSATMSGAFAQNHIPGNLYSAGIISLPLPKATTLVQLWQSNSGQPLKIALQYRDSRKFALSPLMEKRELEEARNILQPSTIFINSLRFYNNCNKEKCNNFSSDAFYDYLIAHKIIATNTEQNKMVIKDLYNNWLDLTRFLHERYLKFATGIDSEVGKTFVEPLSNKSIYSKEELSYAQNLSSKKDWADAAIAWSIIVKKGDLPSWREAHFKRIEGLINSSEGFLAERSLKALMLNAKDSVIRHQAYSGLFPLYEEREYYFGIEGLIAAYFINIGDDEKYLKTLSDILIKDNDEPKALDLAILLKNIRPNDEIIFTAMKNNEARNGARPGTEQETVEDKHFWRAQELQNNGYYDAALKEFKLSGNKGNEWANHLNEALTLKKQLRNNSEDKRNEALDKWLKWYSKHPGPKTWDSANHLVSHFYEAATLYTDIRDSYSTAFIASSNKPVIMSVRGPAKLSVRMRPLLTSAKYLLKDSTWANVKIDNAAHPVKIDNYPNQKVVNVIGKNNVTPGIQQYYEFEVGTGAHEIIIESNKGELLVEPYIYNPLFIITALPPVTQESYEFLKNYYWRIKNEIFPRDVASYELITTMPYKDDYLKKLTTEKSRIQWLPIDYKFKLPILPTQQSTTHKDKERLEVTNLSSKSLYTLKQTPNKYPVTEELSKTLQQYEKTLDKALLVKGKKFCYEHSDDYSVNQICNYFDLLSRWQQILTVDSNPQIILKENEPGWDPEDTRLSLRRNLMEENVDTNYVISDTSVSVMQFVNASPSKLKMKLSFLKLIAENSGDATVGYQIDEDKIQTIYIANADKTIEHELNIPEGKHSLRMFLIQPRQETFIATQLSEKKVEDDKWQQIIAKKKRKYFVATSDAPIKHKVKAPAWIEVHKLEPNGSKNVEDYFIVSGERELVLKNDSKEEQTYYRIFEKVPEHPMVADYQAQPIINYNKMKEAPLLVEPKERKQSSYKINDDLPLTGQSDGTWSLSNYYVAEPAGDTVNGVTVPSGRKLSDQTEKGILRFMQQNITYRYFDEVNRNYINTNLIAREFSDTKSSFGLQARVDHVPVTLPVSLFVEGKTFIQQFNNRNNYSLLGELGARNTLEWNRQLSQNLELSMFARVINYKTAAKLDSKYPDPDVYSHYNKTHLKGLNASYTLNYNPLLDTRLWVGGSYRTSSHFNKKDQAALSIGADQLISPFIIGLSYNNKKYFKGDGSRLYSFNRQKIGGYVNWDQWLTTNNYRVEVDLSIARVFDSNLPKRQFAQIQPKPLKAWMGKIGATIHLGNGRGYRDFKVEELKFRKIREKSIPIKNEIKDY